MPFPTDCLGFCLHHWFLVTSSGATRIIFQLTNQIRLAQKVYMHLVCLFHDKAWCCADCHKCLLNERMRGRKERRKCKYMNDMVCFGGRPFYRRMQKECYSEASLEIKEVHLTVSCKDSNRGYDGRRKGGMHSYWLF